MAQQESEENFDLNLRVAGLVHCRRLIVRDILELEKKEKAGGDSEAIARLALHLLATKSTDGTALQAYELEAVDDAELDLFCVKLVETNLTPERWKDQAKSESVKQEEESGPDYLVRAWKEFFRLPEPLIPDVLKNLRRSAFPSFFAKETIQNLTETAKRSAQLGDVIQQMRAPLAKIDEPTPLKPLVLPQVATNQHLQAIVDHNTAMKSLATECASLIQSMNTTATSMQMDFIANSVKTERQAFWATWIAIGGLAVSILTMVISVIFSYITLMDARGGAKENEKLVDSLKSEIRRLAPEKKSNTIDRQHK